MVSVNACIFILWKFDGRKVILSRCHVCPISFNVLGLSMMRRCFLRLAMRSWRLLLHSSMLTSSSLNVPMCQLWSVTRSSSVQETLTLWWMMWLLPTCLMEWSSQGLWSRSRLLSRRQRGPSLLSWKLTRREGLQLSGQKVRVMLLSWSLRQQQRLVWGWLNWEGLKHRGKLLQLWPSHLMWHTFLVVTTCFWPWMQTVE